MTVRDWSHHSARRLGSRLHVVPFLDSLDFGSRHEDVMDEMVVFLNWRRLYIPGAHSWLSDPIPRSGVPLPKLMHLSLDISNDFTQPGPSSLLSMVTSREGSLKTLEIHVLVNGEMKPKTLGSHWKRFCSLTEDAKPIMVNVRPSRALDSSLR